MPAPTLKISLVEPIIYLRSERERHGLGRSSVGDVNTAVGGADERNQLRGLVHVDFGDVVDSAVDAVVKVTFQGTSVWVHWQNGKGKNRQREIVSKIVEIPATVTESSSDGNTSSRNTSVPFSIPISEDLPPSVEADFGSNCYCVTASIELKGKTHCADTAVWVEPYFDTDALPVSVAGTCYHDMINYDWRSEGEACIGVQMPVDLSLMSVGDVDVSVTAMRLTLEETTTYGTPDEASTGRSTTRRWPLLKLSPSPPKEELLPWSAWGTECVLNGKLDAEMVSAARLFSSTQQQRSDHADVKISDATPQAATAKARPECSLREDLMQKMGPWNLSWMVQIPSCISTPINNTILHEMSAVHVTHRLVFQISLKNPSADAATIVMKRPIRILSSHLAESGAALPCYWCDTMQDHPYMHEETWRQLDEQCDATDTTVALPKWLKRLLNKPIIPPTSKTAPPTEDYAKNSMQWLSLTSQAPPYVE